MLVDIKTAADLEKYKGKLAGKILLLNEAREYKRGVEPDSKRYDEADLTELQTFAVPKDGSRDRAKRLKDIRRAAGAGQAHQRVLR